MAAINDVYMVQLGTLRGNNRFNNIFTYKALSTVCTAALVAEDFAATVAANVMAALQTTMQLEYVYAENMNSLADFQTFVPVDPIFGQRSGTIANDMLAVSFKSARKLKTVRPGQKRFGALSSTDIIANTIVTGGAYQAILVSLQDALRGDLLDSEGGLMARPIVIRRNKEPNEKGGINYVIPATATASNHYVADNWSLNVILSSQVTRKSGRGI